MREIFVLVEHRKGGLREITLEMLTKGKELAERSNSELTALLLGYELKDFSERLKGKAKKVLVVEDKRLENFNSEAYQKVLSHLNSQYKPTLTLIGHTAFGMDLAPSLAIELNLPLVTDCIGLDLENGNLIATRQVYHGKVNARVSLTKSDVYLATIRQGAFPIKEYALPEGKIVTLESPLSEEIRYKEFLEYLEAPQAEVDITKGDIIVAVGRGIKDADNISLVEKLSQALGGVLACSRPIVDKKWLPKYRQVGTSGKTVKPKVYIAIGISGAFQHIAGIGGGTIIAINKDPAAPIFRMADYGIVDDLFKVVPALTKRIGELRAT